MGGWLLFFVEETALEGTSRLGTGRRSASNPKLATDLPEALKHNRHITDAEGAGSSAFLLSVTLKGCFGLVSGGKGPRSYVWAYGAIPRKDLRGQRVGSRTSWCGERLCVTGRYNESC